MKSTQQKKKFIYDKLYRFSSPVVHIDEKEILDLIDEFVDCFIDLGEDTPKLKIEFNSEIMKDNKGMINYAAFVGEREHDEQKFGARRFIIPEDYNPKLCINPDHLQLFNDPSIPLKLRSVTNFVAILKLLVGVAHEYEHYFQFDYLVGFDDEINENDEDFYLMKSILCKAWSEEDLKNIIDFEKTINPNTTIKDERFSSLLKLDYLLSSHEVEAREKERSVAKELINLSDFLLIKDEVLRFVFVDPLDTSFYSVIEGDLIKDYKKFPKEKFQKFSDILDELYNDYLEEKDENKLKLFESKKSLFINLFTMYTEELTKEEAKKLIEENKKDYLAAGNEIAPKILEELSNDINKNLKKSI